MRKFNTMPKRLILSFMMSALVAFQFSCTSLTEEPQLTIEAEQSQTDLITLLENYKAEADPFLNARSSNAVPAFKTLTSALNITGFLSLAARDKATSFVPTDEAFSKYGLNFGNIGTAIPMEFLQVIIANHVVSGQMVFGKDLESASLPNNTGTSLTVKTVNGQLMVFDAFGNSANIIRTDFRALNGVAHFIDNVMIPQ
ncbi:MULTISPECIES: fasciclin domain-containing protein [Rhodonellum]|nr:MULTISPECIES: fasciclin domain-containing protein [Rhodonellum]MDO9554904.1 fasciclin domain-containing protein [Rhodonellum sp.]